MENDASSADASPVAKKETSVNENGTEEDKQTKNHGACNSESPLNGTMNELIGELDYEEDDEIAEKQGSCKRPVDENVQASISDCEKEKLIVHCTSDEIETPAIEEIQSPVDSDKDEGEISDEDEMEEGSLDGEIKDDDELEEGEVKDPIPTTTHQSGRLVCRFFNNGNCTWGNQCRFLHLSLKDHGCYNMFGMQNTKKFVPHIIHTNDMPLVIPRQHIPRNRVEIHRPPPSKPPNPPPTQSAWDYGLQCVKEALEISNQRKKQEFNYEEKKLNLNSEETVRVTDNKENYDYVKPSYHIPTENFHMKHEEHKSGRDKFPPPRNTWNKQQEESQGPMRRNKWRDKQLSEIQTVRARGDEWRDPWRRSQSPKDRSRKRDLSSCSSISSDSYSTRTSSSPYSSRSSSVSSRSLSVDKTYQKGKTMEEPKRRKISPFHEQREVSSFKEKSVYGRKIRRHSRSASRNRDVYRSQSPASKSRSRSRSHSPSLSNVSSASSRSSSSHPRSVRKVEKVVTAKPQPTKKAIAPTRTLFEEMQRLVQHRQRADDQKAEENAPSTSKASNQPNAVQIKVEIKEEPISPRESPEKPKMEQAKSIGFRRIKLMKQLRAVEDAIARKRQKFCL